MVVFLWMQPYTVSSLLKIYYFTFTSSLLAEDTLMESLLEDKARDSFTFFFTDFHKEAMISY